MLFLLGVVAAVRRSDRSLSRDLLGEGATVADRLGADGNARYTAFGPTNVVLHRVAALTDLHEAIGMGLPLVSAPSLNSAQAAHPAFEQNVAVLRAAGVTVLYGPGIYEPGPPRTGGRPYDWGLVVRAVNGPPAA
jgi:hypothetical protein